MGFGRSEKAPTNAELRAVIAAVLRPARSLGAHETRGTRAARRSAAPARLGVPTDPGTRRRLPSPRRTADLVRQRLARGQVRQTSAHPAHAVRRRRLLYQPRLEQELTDLGDQSLDLTHGRPGPTSDVICAPSPPSHGKSWNSSRLPDLRHQYPSPRLASSIANRNHGLTPLRANGARNITTESRGYHASAISQVMARLNPVNLSTDCT